jgi:hypothetical protein
MAALVRHLHAFAREVELTEEEWFAGIDFLTRTGKASSGSRQEFVLLSDIGALNADRRPRYSDTDRNHRINGVRPLLRRWIS